MKIPHKIASGTLILIGLGWLSSVVWQSRSWSDQSANQMPSNAQESLPSQNFTPPQGPGSFADDGTAIGTDQADSSGQRRVTQAGQSVPSNGQTTSANDQTTSATPAATASPSPTVSPSPAASPSPTPVPEPIRAGW